jgi:hypothetical protein
MDLSPPMARYSGAAYVTITGPTISAAYAVRIPARLHLFECVVIALLLLESFASCLRRLQNLLRRFCKRSIQKPEFSIQNWNPLTGNVYYYSDSCLLYSDFSLANTPEGFCKSLVYSLLIL